MKRGPKPGKARRVVLGASGPTGLGECPADLVGLGRQLWLDTVAHLEATGGALTVHRTGLLVACRAVEGLRTDAGLNRLDCVRRWLHELGLTPTTMGRGAEVQTPDDDAQDGRARLLSLLARKTESA